jgi:hypothetical protein
MVRSCTRVDGLVELTNVVIRDVLSRVSHDLFAEKQTSRQHLDCCKAAQLEPSMVVKGPKFLVA